MKKIIKMWNRQALPIILITGYLREEKMKNAKKIKTKTGFTS